MRADLNKVLLMGRVHRQPRIIREPEATAHLQLAVRSRSKGTNGDVEARDEVHNVWCFDGCATFCERSLRTGMYLSVEGVLRRSKRDSYVAATSMRLLGRALWEGAAQA